MILYAWVSCTLFSDIVLCKPRQFHATWSCRERVVRIDWTRWQVLATIRSVVTPYTNHSLCENTCDFTKKSHV